RRGRRKARAVQISACAIRVLSKNIGAGYAECFSRRCLEHTRRTNMKLRMVLALVFLTATTLAAQTFRGTILGTVTDASGAVVPGATVQVQNVNTGLQRTTQTSTDGSYSVTELPIGLYTVTIKQSGFQTSLTNNVSVDVAGERRVDLALKTGQVSEVVEVTGEQVPLLETTS